MPGKPIDLQFPLAGVHRGVGFQQESPYYCDDAMNMWPRDQLAGRMRGGSRPGLEKAFATGVTGPVHLLANVRLVETSGTGINQTTYTIDYGQYPDLGTQWNTAPWGGLIAIRSTGAQGFIAPTSYTGVTSGGLVLDNLQIQTSKIYTITLEIPFSGYRRTDGTIADGPPDAYDAVYSIFIRMANAGPSLPYSGVLIEADYSEGFANGRARITEYRTGEVFGTPSVTTRVTNMPQYAGRLTAAITVDSCVATLSNAISSASVTRALQTESPAGSQLLGFGIRGVVPADANDTQQPGNARLMVNLFSVTYTASKPVPNRNIVVAAGGTNAGASTTLDVKYEDTINVLVRPTTVSASTVNPNARFLQAAELLGKLYIVGEDIGSVTGPVEPWPDSLWVFDPQGAGAIGSIAEVHALGGVNAFSPVPTTTPSIPPTDCTWICAWRNRLVLGGKRSEPQNVFMSKAGEPQNWTYGALPVGSALAFNTTGIDTGKLGEPVRCGIPHSDDLLLLGCQTSLYVLRGDPTYGGQIDRLSSSVGIVAPQAWARGPDGETVFLTTDGLYAIAAGVSGYPQSVSRDALPQELRDIDVDNYRVLMAYDLRNRGVFIGVTPMLGSGGKYFWLDWSTRGFWPMEFAPSHEPTALSYRAADAPSSQRLLLGCRDGHIRALNGAAFDDDGIPIPHRVLLGPIMLGGGGYYDGMLLEYVGQLALGSGPMTAEVMIGNSVEGARNATPRFSMPQRAGKNLTYRPRLRGNACFVKLSSPGGAVTALETQSMSRERLGKQRL